MIMGLAAESSVCSVYENSQPISVFLGHFSWWGQIPKKEPLLLLPGFIKLSVFWKPGWEACGQLFQHLVGIHFGYRINISNFS